MNEPAAHPRSPPIAAVDSAGPAPEYSSGALKLAIIGPTDPHQGGVAAHTTHLAHHLAQAGHDVTLVSWSRPFPFGRPARAGAAPVAPGIPAFPRTVRVLSWARPDTWVRTGRRLRGFDAIVVVHVSPLAVPAHLAILRAAGGAPRSIVVAHQVLPKQPRPGEGALVRSLFERVDAVMVHSQEHARRARDLQAARVLVADAVQVSVGDPGLSSPDPDLSSPWAYYVGAMEALASPHSQAAEQDPPMRSPAPSLRTRLATDVRQALRRQRPMLPMARGDLPEWARPSDVLADADDADDARAWARSYGLPRCTDPVAAWAALGALAAIVRLSDDGQRSALIVDGSGSRSPFSRWAKAIGFVPVGLDFTGSRSKAIALDVDTGSLDVITALHPNGCDSEDVDEALGQASWALRSGGLISLTLPLGPASADGAVGPADVRAILARAHALGFVLVGDLDGDITALMRAARRGERRSDAAYALVRLTFRRL